MWAAGVAAGGAWVASQRIVGRGFDWLVAGTASVLAAAAAWAGGGPWAIVAAVSAMIAAVLGGRRIPVVASLIASAVTALLSAALIDSWLLAVTGSLTLGGITVEMLLGHWFLVDPRLPRSALRTLASLGALGAGTDLAVSFLGGIEGLVPVSATLSLGVVTLVLMVLVYLALRERGYSGVMAATGLSYLAVLTGAGAVAASRAALVGSFLGLG